jgi:hypothetical protein
LASAGLTIILARGAATNEVRGNSTNLWNDRNEISEVRDLGMETEVLPVGVYCSGPRIISLYDFDPGIQQSTGHAARAAKQFNRPH